MTNLYISVIQFVIYEIDSINLMISSLNDVLCLFRINLIIILDVDIFLVIIFKLKPFQSQALRRVFFDHTKMFCPTNHEITTIQW